MLSYHVKLLTATSVQALRTFEAHTHTHTHTVFEFLEQPGQHSVAYVNSTQHT